MSSERAADVNVVVPSKHTQRFDRQLRLWGAEGQAALERAHVVLLGATAAGCEMLKNLVLPNVGFFSVVDDRVVSLRDLGSNFFLAPEDVGAPIASAAVRNLQELNASRQAATKDDEDERSSSHNEHSGAPLGQAIQQGPVEFLETLLSSGDDGFDRLGRQGGGCTVVLVCTPLVPPSLLVRVSNAVSAWHKCRPQQASTMASLNAAASPASSTTANHQTGSVTLVYLEVCGLVGIYRAQADRRFIVHTHPQPELVVKDLRPFEPFPALEAWFQEHDPTDDTKFGPNSTVYGTEALARHSHIPWPCVLYHALRLHRAALGDESWVPKLSRDFATLRQVITDQIIRRRTPPQESMLEALAECTPSLDLTKRKVPALTKLLNDPRSAHPSSNDDLSWFILHGIRTFSEKHNGRMPLSGDVPDMSATTDWFREMASIYRHQAEVEAGQVTEYVHDAICRSTLQHHHHNNRSAALPSSHAVTSSSSSALSSTPEALHQIVRDVCRHCWSLASVEFIPIAEEYGKTPLRIAVGASTACDCAFVEWYAVHRAARVYFERFGTFPGDTTESLLTTTADDGAGDAWLSESECPLPQCSSKPTAAPLSCATALKHLIDILHNEILKDVDDGDEHTRTWTRAGLELRAREYVRYGGGEVNCVASIVGAAAAQEAIKLIQRRRVPAKDAVVFDGNACCFGTIVVQ